MAKKSLLSLALPFLHSNFKESFTWSSGYVMPVYFDGKSFLSVPEHRAAVLQQFQELQPEKYQTIAATAMGGLVPAASLAGAVDKPLAFLYHGNLYRFTPGVVEKVISGYVHYSSRNCDLIVSTAPFGILPGIHLADTLGLPFAYVRREKKMHGTQQKIEGWKGGKCKAILIDWYEGKSYGAQALRKLEEQQVDVVEYKDLEIPSQRKGKLGRTLHVEDVVSFGNSSLRDICTERICGATIEQCMAVFTYNFPETQKRFSQENCLLQPLLAFEDLLAASSWADEEKGLLKAWHEKPKQWKESERVK